MSRSRWESIGQTRPRSDVKWNSDAKVKVSSSPGGFRIELLIPLKDLPPLTVYESEITPEDEALAAVQGDKTTTVRRENNKFIVEGEWLFRFMGQIRFDDYDSLNFFQRVLVKNGVIDQLRAAGVKEGDTVSIYDFEFDFVY